MLRSGLILVLIATMVAGPIAGAIAPALAAEARNPVKTGTLDCSGGFCVDVYKLKCAGGSLTAHADVRATSTSTSNSPPPPGSPGFLLGHLLAEILEDAFDHLGILGTVLHLLVGALKVILGIADGVVLTLGQLLGIVINNSLASQLQ